MVSVKNTEKWDMSVDTGAAAGEDKRAELREIADEVRYGWAFTALYSNTKRAHELDKTHDWVVLYYERDGEEDQATVVTETRGPLGGKRVIRGRESETREYYEEVAGSE
jgi:hypothetical protein